jgi:hypothetical protein
MSSARYGVVANVSVACSVCGVQATLPQWVAAAEQTRQERDAIVNDRRYSDIPEVTAYLRNCPGKKWAQYVERSNNPPRYRKELS